jgi:hypothetical protein
VVSAGGAPPRSGGGREFFLGLLVGCRPDRAGVFNEVPPSLVTSGSIASMESPAPSHPEFGALSSHGGGLTGVCGGIAFRHGFRTAERRNNSKCV